VKVVVQRHVPHVPHGLAPQRPLHHAHVPHDRAPQQKLHHAHGPHDRALHRAHAPHAHAEQWRLHHALNHALGHAPVLVHVQGEAQLVPRCRCRHCRPTHQCQAQALLYGPRPGPRPGHDPGPDHGPAPDHALGEVGPHGCHVSRW
jgi:hypothetical protein